MLEDYARNIIRDCQGSENETIGSGELDMLTIQNTEKNKSNILLIGMLMTPYTEKNRTNIPENITERTMRKY